MKAGALLEELAAGRVRPAYLLGGGEALLRDDARHALEQAVLGDSPRDFNLDRLEIGKLPPGRLEEALASLPMMGARRLVELREPAGGRTKIDGRWSEAIEAALGRLEVDGPAVLVVISAKPDKRLKWVKAFREPAAFVECEAPTKSRELTAFVTDEAHRQGLELEDGAAALLAERVGPQLLLIRQELGKAALLAGVDAVVERRHVEIAVASVAEEPIWDLTDAIGQGRTAEAIALLARLHGQGEASQAVLGALASHYRRLVRVGHGESVPGPPFVRRKLEQQARRVPPARLVAALRAIHRTDVELKGASALTPARALEQLVLTLAG